MFAVISRWTSDPARTDELDRELREAIVPGVCARPGFVSGCWSRDRETGRAHATVVWDSEEGAVGFKAAVEANRQHAARQGLVNEFLIIGEVVARG